MNNIGKCYINNESDENGNPTGGCVDGKGLHIEWQDGPLGRHAEGCGGRSGGDSCVVGCTRTKPNGAFVETVISAALQRIEFYQASKFECSSNADAILALKAALDSLDSRTREREKRGVEGAHKV